MADSLGYLSEERMLEAVRKHRRLRALPGAWGAEQHDDDHRMKPS